jgi:hypothetical protein
MWILLIQKNNFENSYFFCHVLGKSLRFIAMSNDKLATSLRDATRSLLLPRSMRLRKL